MQAAPEAPKATPKTAKVITNDHGVKVGDIFYTSWGYEQTNIDFFEVIAVTAKMATVREIGQKSSEEYCNGMAGYCEPVKEGDLLCM